MKVEFYFINYLLDRVRGIMSAAALLRPHFKPKKDGTPLTWADSDVNRLVVDAFTHSGISVFSEEGSRIIPGAKDALICDPLDGTIPFCAGIYDVCTFCLSIMEHSCPKAGVIANLLSARSDTRYFGFDKASNRKYKKLKPSDDVSGIPVVVNYWNNAPFDLFPIPSILGKIRIPTITPLAVGFAALGIVSGRLAGSIFPGPFAWETPAMQMIVEEAGGIATDLYGDPLMYDLDGKKPIMGKGHIIAHPAIHKMLVDIVAKVL